MPVLCALLVLALASSAALAQDPVSAWPPHSTQRPRPQIVKPGAPSLPVPPPADARVLFDGTSLARWASDSGKPARWRIVDGAFEVVAGTGTLVTRDSFGDVQLHVEWMSPRPPHGTDQDRGNSGVFFMGMYEVQVLDSYDNVTYADGQAGALYGQYPPLVNVSRPPGEWQSYDIVFHRPRFDARGAVTSKARFTVLHNGVLIQDNVELVGPTAHRARPPYAKHADRLPISLQDHGHAVRYRNIWVRELEK